MAEDQWVRLSDCCLQHFTLAFGAVYDDVRGSGKVVRQLRNEVAENQLFALQERIKHLRLGSFKATGSWHQN